jgi:hypothetical protein
MLDTPLTGKDNFRKNEYLPNRGYDVISVPFFIWEQITRKHLQKPFLRALFKTKGINI